MFVKPFSLDGKGLRRRSLVNLGYSLETLLILALLSRAFCTAVFPARHQALPTVRGAQCGSWRVA
jgi:hypothetical protein